VALNALIERTGVKVGLLCTEGHEDSLEIRLGHKEEGHRYDAHYPPAHMLAPRHLRRPIGGRILGDGREHSPLDEAAIRRHRLLPRRRRAGRGHFLRLVGAQPQPRTARRRTGAAALPGVFVCTGSEVFPQIREYTRTSTTVVNAYLSPVMAATSSASTRCSRSLARSNRCATSSPTAAWRPGT
jgi:N-methylhydantoinase A